MVIYIKFILSTELFKTEFTISYPARESTYCFKKFWKMNAMIYYIIYNIYAVNPIAFTLIMFHRIFFIGSLLILGKEVVHDFHSCEVVILDSLYGELRSLKVISVVKMELMWEKNSAHCFPLGKLYRSSVPVTKVTLRYNSLKWVSSLLPGLL